MHRTQLTGTSGTPAAFESAAVGQGLAGLLAGLPVLWMLLTSAVDDKISRVWLPRAPLGSSYRTYCPASRSTVCPEKKNFFVNLPEKKLMNFPHSPSPDAEISAQLMLE